MNPRPLYATALRRARAAYDTALRRTPWALDARLTAVEHRQEITMSKTTDALARLDGQIEALRAYVVSDDETDAAEVDRRTEEIKAVLAEAQGAADEEIGGDGADDAAAPDALDAADVDAGVGPVAAQPDGGEQPR